jgi:predicted O-methyltransferase YrrM
LEAEPGYAEIARANIDRAGLSQMIDVRLGLALDTLPRLSDKGCQPFDMIFIDADKENNPGYCEWAMKLSRRGSLIIIDNVVRDGAVINADSDDVNIQGVRRCNEMIAADPRLTATAIQTVGAKGYEGFAIMLVTSEP